MCEICSKLALKAAELSCSIFSKIKAGKSVKQEVKFYLSLSTEHKIGMVRIKIASRNIDM